MVKLIFDNFVLTEDTELTGDEQWDRRLDIYVRNPVMNIESYLRYLYIIKTLVNTVTPDDVSSGTSKGDILTRNYNRDYMFKLGFIPLVMLPSFWNDDLRDLIISKFPPDIPYYTRPPMGLRGRYNCNTRFDIWVSKLDVEALCGCPAANVTVEKVFKACGI